MKVLRAVLAESAAFETASEALRPSGALVDLSCATDSARLHLVDALGDPFPVRIILTHSEVRAKALCERFAFYDRDVSYFPAKDLIFYQADIHAGEIVRERMRTFRRMLKGGSVTVVTTFAALMAPQIAPDILRESILHFETGKRLPAGDIAKALVALGYERSHQAERPGEFAIRGDIIDIFDLTRDNPVRIECWGDDIDSIRIFDAESQRSIEKITRTDIFPATELILDEDRLQEGLKFIEKDAVVQEDRLRKQMRTEEGHRLRTTIDTLKEELLTLHLHVNLEPYLKYFYDRVYTLTDNFRTEDVCLFLDEPARISEHAQAVEAEFRDSMSHRVEEGYILPAQADLLTPVQTLCAKLMSFRRVALEGIDAGGVLSLFPDEVQNAVSVSFAVQGIAPYNNRFDMLVRDLKRYRKEGWRIVILSFSRARAKRLVEDLRDNEVESFYAEDPNRVLQKSEVMTYYGACDGGFAYTDLKFAVISESDIFSVRKTKRRKKHKAAGDVINDFSDLKIGDYVVHEDHGLGIYRGVEQIEVEKTLRDYIRIEYADGGNLYVAATGLSVIQKYASGSAEGKEKKVRLNKLGGAEWSKAKAKVQSAVDEIAEDLVALYAKRMQVKGHAFPLDTVWQQEFEEAFPYEETSDQLTAITEMKHDMESERVMDRLLCGDVGFGKTEVAIRGAFKAVQDSKQVAVLVPTTILAQQHYNTFVERFRNFPVRIDLLSRFRTQKEQKKTVDDLRKGLVDIVIGTHRLLSSDVTFKDLGLLVVDEEQRFGVSHKEKIKKIRASVDVLTLSATPIPRTLHMSLTGIRDMSLLTEAPLDRLPIQTFVCEHNDATVREAIMRELARGGQVYYVYNRINTIADISAHLQELAPSARIAYAHGQMPEGDLEKIMYDFIGGDIDVLVSTVIIETGLDIPNVNTMIIHDSDRMGLAQLYQLRGRVGRSNRTAYAFLMYKRDRVLREVAERRLNAIREFTDLGSGYKIAMRDLEIRGAGNLLGTRQSGHMAAVGYELYCRMLDDALRAAKGEIKKGEGHFATNIDLNVDAYIPGTYILNEEQKLEIYKRIAAMEDEAEEETIRDELIDRFGALPVSVDNLIRIARIRMRAHALFVTEVKSAEGALQMLMKADAALDPSGIPALIETYKGRLRFHTGVKPAFRLQVGNGLQAVEGEIWLSTTEQILDDMEKAFDPGNAKKEVRI